MSDDLTVGALEEALPGRPLQVFPTLLSTEVAAMQWARKDAPHGAVVLADYQVAPRGRADRPWKVQPGQGLGFSLVLRPQLAVGREGWLYVVVAAALADVCGEGSRIEWPDEVHREDALVAAVGVRAELGSEGIRWAVVNLHIPYAQPPRGALLAAVLEAIDARLAGAPSALVEDYRDRCATIGRRVSVRLLGGTGPRLEGTAVDVLEDGALVLENDDGRRTPLRPQDFRRLEEA